MRAVLWGTDHEELGAIAAERAGDRIAVAITRGRFAKAYRHVDANEDAVAAVAGPRANLLVCADAHNGALAGILAVRQVLATLGDDPPPGLADREWIELFESVNDAIMAEKGPGSQQPSSNTVLLAVLESGGALQFASIGDAALVVARAGAERGRQLNREAMRFAGYPMSRRALKGVLHRGSAALAHDEWVVLASDGLSEFVAPVRPAEVVPPVIAAMRAGGPEAVALGLIETACSAGAGDNVAVAVLAPSDG